MKFIIFLINTFFILPVIRIFFPNLVIDVPLIIIFLLILNDVKISNFLYLFVFGIFNDYFYKLPLTFLYLFIYWVYFYLKSRINFSLIFIKFFRDLFLFIPLLIQRNFIVFLFSFLIFFIIDIIPWKKFFQRIL